MKQGKCVSNRNIGIIASYVESLLGDSTGLFKGLQFPADRYGSAREFYTNEDEWTSFDVFQDIFRRAKDLVGDPDFYFKCGASAAVLDSWGRFSYFIRLFSNPSEGIKRLPFFNRSFNDTKDVEVVLPPEYDKKTGKIRTVIKIKFNKEYDPNRDYIGDPYLRGMVSFIPTIWGLEPAVIKQRMNEYDPEVLFNQEQEFNSLGLDARVEKNELTIYCPVEKRRRAVGKKVLLKHDIVRGRKVFLGDFSEAADKDGSANERPGAILISEPLRVDNRDILTPGEIYKAPYFILEVTYDRIRAWQRLAHIYRVRKRRKDSVYGLMEIVNQLREAIFVKNRTFEELESANLKLKEANEEIDNYAGNLEKMVEGRTAELKGAKEELIVLNRDLKEKVDQQVGELSRYNELRRYLSPKITDIILSSERDIKKISHRKLLTVLFSDIAGFSDVTDSLEPEEITLLLNNYLSEMIELIHRYEGTLNKIIGDGIMVFFGDPVSIDDHAGRAVLMAIEMQKKTGQLRNEWQSYGYDLRVRIGINTGYMTVGNIGSEYYRDYTVIGNQVNIAARLETMAGPGDILVSQRTYTKAREVAGFEKTGKVNLKGIHSAVEVYRVLY